MSSVAFNSTTSQTDPDLKIACVYALSGQYGTLPRLLYYATLVLAIFGRNKEWLVIGALVSSLAYAATAAIHMMALVNSRKVIFDFDALGAWAILSTAALSYIAMIHWSSTVRNSKARIVMVIWGMLVGISLIFARVILFDSPFGSFERPCYSSDGMILDSPLQLIKTEFNCSYTCFNIDKPLRGRDEIIAVPQSTIDNKYWRLSFILIGPVMFAAYAAISWDSQQHTPSQLCTRAVVKYLQPIHKQQLVKLIWNASHETWYGGYVVLYHYIKRSPWSPRKILVLTLTYPWLALGLIMDALCLPFLVINVVLNELNLLGSGIPVNESMYNVGQWAPWVNSAVVVIAAIINKALEVREERKVQKEKEKEKEKTEHEFELRRMDTSATLVEEVDFGSDEYMKGVDPELSNAHIERPPNALGRIERLV